MTTSGPSAPRPPGSNGVLSRHVATLALAAVLPAMVVPRLALSLCINEFGADGGYYSDIAQNVRDGLGLTTDISVFHQAFPSFPFPTPVYPLWPLVYGVASLFAPLPIVGVWLPTLFYFVIVALAYRVGQRLAPRLDLAGLLPGIHGGHVFALVAGLTSELVRATSRPYTEGLAYTLLFVLFLRAPGLFRRMGLVAGLELGAWLIALFLTRSQLVVVAIATAGAMVVALWTRPRAALPFLLGTAAVGGSVWFGYLHWLGTFLPNASMGTYVRFDLARVSEALSPVPVMVQTPSTFERLLDIADGFPKAFSFYDSSATFYHLHHAYLHVVPLAGLALLLEVRRLPLLLRFLRSRAGPHAAFFLLSALGLLFSLHTVHKVYGSPWVFGSRHAIPSLFLVATSLIYLLRSRSAFRLVGMFLLAAGTYGGWRDLALTANDQCVRYQYGTPLMDYRIGLREFLVSERERLGTLTVAVERPEPQRLAWRTPGVGFHWLTETTTIDDLTVMVDSLGVRYVVLFDEFRNDTLGVDPRFPERFVLASTFRESSAGGDDDAAESNVPGKYARVYAPRCSAFPDQPPATCLEASPATDAPAAEAQPAAPAAPAAPAVEESRVLKALHGLASPAVPPPAPPP